MSCAVVGIVCFILGGMAGVCTLAIVAVNRNTDVIEYREAKKDEDR